MMQINISTKYFLSLSFDWKFATPHPDPRIEVCVRYYLSCPCVLFTVWDLLFISSISVGRTGRPWDLSVAVEKGSNSLDWLAHEIIVMWGDLVFQWPRKRTQIYVWGLNCTHMYIVPAKFDCSVLSFLVFGTRHMQCLVFSAFEIHYFLSLILSFLRENWNSNCSRPTPSWKHLAMPKQSRMTTPQDLASSSESTSMLVAILLAPT